MSSNDAGAVASILTNFANARNTFGRGTPQLLPVLRILMEAVDQELAKLHPLDLPTVNGLLDLKGHIESEMRTCATPVEGVQEKLAKMALGKDTPSR